MQIHCGWKWLSKHITVCEDDSGNYLSDLNPSHLYKPWYKDIFSVARFRKVLNHIFHSGSDVKFLSYFSTCSQNLKMSVPSWCSVVGFFLNKGALTIKITACKIENTFKFIPTCTWFSSSSQTDLRNIPICPKVMVSSYYSVRDAFPDSRSGRAVRKLCYFPTQVDVGEGGSVKKFVLNVSFSQEGKEQA